MLIRLAGAEIATGRVLLKGVPVPSGNHLRFEEDEAQEVVASPSNTRTLLRGVDRHTGSHIRFD